MHKRYDIGSGPVPPLHPACRSTTVPAIDEAFSALREGAKRTSRGDDGVKLVDASLGSYDWLKTQSREFQDEAIGKSWAKLFRDGGLSADRFAEITVNRLGRPLTLDEARELEPVAFSKAGL